MAKIILASTSEHKLAAVKEAFSKILDGPITVTIFKSDSGVAEQPVGWREIYRGAINRISFLGKRIKGGVYDYLVAIENGIVFLDFDKRGKWYDVGLVIIESSQGKRAVSFTAGIEMPLNLVEEARKRGFSTITVGALMAKTYGGESTDPHSILTRGAVSRKSLLVQAIKIAIAQVIFQQNR